MKGYFEKGSIHPALIKRGITQDQYTEALANGEKWCSGTCKAFRPKSDFWNNYSKCRTCAATLNAKAHARRKEMGEGYSAYLVKINQQRRDRRYNRTHPESSHLRYFYGIEVDEYKAKLAEQNGHCAICEAVTSTSKSRFLSVDHDHSHCGKYKACRLCIRGLLCNRCNFIVGILESNGDRIAAAYEYLNKYKRIP